MSGRGRTRTSRVAGTIQARPERRTAFTAQRLLFSLAVIACGMSAGLVGACANDGVTPNESPPPDGPSRVPDAEVDASVDAAEVEAGPCTDCEYFVDSCQADVLCPNGPFEANTKGGALDARTQINVIRGRSANDVWAAGALGALAHFDGASWSRFESDTMESLQAVWLRDSDEVAFGRPESLYTRGIDMPDAGASADGWTHQAPVLVSTYTQNRTRLMFESAWAAPGAEWLWIGMRYQSTGTPPSGLWRLRRSSAGTFEVAVGLPGGTYQKGIKSIHGSSPDVLWAVGLEGATLRISGAQGDAPSYEIFNSQTWNALSGVWSASETEAWSVGAAGTIRHYAGGEDVWDVVPDVPTTANLNAVWGSSATDVWAAGDAALVLHYDGTRWSRVKVAGLGPRRPDLLTVWSPGPGQVWIGGHGIVLSLGGNP